MNRVLHSIDRTTLSCYLQSTERGWIGLDLHDHRAGSLRPIGKSPVRHVQRNSSRLESDAGWTGSGDRPRRCSASAFDLSKLFEDGRGLVAERHVRRIVHGIDSAGNIRVQGCK